MLKKEKKKKKSLHAFLHMTFVLSATPTSLPGEGLLLQVLADLNWAGQRTWFQNTSLHLQLLQCVSWSVISDSATPARQASLSMKFSRQEYWTGQPFPPPGDLPDPGIKPGSPVLHTDYLPSEPPGKTTAAVGPNSFLYLNE